MLKYISAFAAALIAFVLIPDAGHATPLIEAGRILYSISDLEKCIDQKSTFNMKTCLRHDDYMGKAADMAREVIANMNRYNAIQCFDKTVACLEKHCGDRFILCTTGDKGKEVDFDLAVSSCENIMEQCVDNADKVAEKLSEKFETLLYDAIDTIGIEKKQAWDWKERAKFAALAQKVKKKLAKLQASIAAANATTTAAKK
ncbi:MAG: hypothetical protein LBH81_01820 [Rickettsiales bacterium]|jgi:hypothetical protein|nr:hypothetical protein [Rickettsiales bacterium]